MATREDDHGIHLLSSCGVAGMGRSRALACVPAPALALLGLRNLRRITSICLDVDPRLSSPRPSSNSRSPSDQSFQDSRPCSPFRQCNSAAPQRWRFLWGAVLKACLSGEGVMRWDRAVCADVAPGCCAPRRPKECASQGGAAGVAQRRRKGHMGSRQSCALNCARHHIHPRTKSAATGGEVWAWERLAGNQTTLWSAWVTRRDTVCVSHLYVGNAVSIPLPME